MFKSIITPIHPAGWPFITIFLIASIIFWAIAIPLGVIGIILTLWCSYFFRNPDRVTPTKDGLIICPADGIVQMISSVKPPTELSMGEEQLCRVSIFMNVFNVHVNRSPISGIVSVKKYHKGQFFNASLDKASELNERMSLKVKTENGIEVGFIQIAGLIARRILCFVEEGDNIKSGERFGLIRFGSRVDIFLPKNIVPLVCLGQTTIAGETVLADLNSDETVRYGSKT